jgi:hypothetical protein
MGSLDIGAVEFPGYGYQARVEGVSLLSMRRISINKSKKQVFVHTTFPTLFVSSLVIIKKILKSR